MATKLKMFIHQSARLNSILLRKPNHASKIFDRSYHQTTTKLRGWFDARDPDIEEKNKQLVIREGNVFDEAKKKAAANKATFHQAIDHYLTRNKKYRRGSVEFITAAMDYMEEFGVHRDMETYKKLLCILPKDVMVSRTIWMAEFMYYPKQQDCIINLLEKMEVNKLVPDDEVGKMLIDRFGPMAHVFRKYQRIMYWMPKFKNANPYPVPFDVPEDPLELAKLALRRMAVDLENKLSIFQTGELETSSEDTFIVSASSPIQMELISGLDTDKPVFVEGGFKTWLNGTMLKYYTLRSETSETFKKSQLPIDKEEEEKTWFKFDPFFTDENLNSVVVKPSVHEQKDGTVLGMCITGTNSEESLRSWITFLQKTNPKLAQTPVVFSLISEEEGLQAYEDTQQKHYDEEARR